jgi:hypothetical protein
MRSNRLSYRPALLFLLLKGHIWFLRGDECSTLHRGHQGRIRGCERVPNSVGAPRRYTWNRRGSTDQAAAGGWSVGLREAGRGGDLATVPCRQQGGEFVRRDWLAKEVALAVLAVDLDQGG